MLEDAVDDGLLEVDAARTVKLPERAPIGERRMTMLTPEQIELFLAKTDADPLGPLYRLALATGMRRGELVALRWSDVELDATQPRLTLRQAITHRTGPIRLGPPKSKAGTRRQVALDAGIVEVLRAHRRKRAAQRIATGHAWSDGDLAFCYEEGTPLRPDLVTRRWSILCKRADVPIVRLHDGRHTHASMALDAGVDVKVVSERLGHSSTTITRDVYQHVSPTVAADAANPSPP